MSSAKAALESDTRVLAYEVRTVHTTDRNILDLIAYVIHWTRIWNSSFFFGSTARALLLFYV
jgi:hypothetical protein